MVETILRSPVLNERAIAPICRALANEGLNLQVPIRAPDEDDCAYYYDCVIGGASTRCRCPAGQCYRGEVYGYCENCEDVDCGFRGMSD